MPKESQKKIAAMNAELAKLDETLPDSTPEEPAVPGKVVPLAVHGMHVDIIGLSIHWAHSNIDDIDPIPVSHCVLPPYLSHIPGPVLLRRCTSHSGSCDWGICSWTLSAGLDR